MVGHHKHRRVEGRLITPPSLPLKVLPGSPMRTELVASHNLRPDVALEIPDEIVVNPLAATWLAATGPMCSRERPSHQFTWISMPEGVLKALALSGAVAVT